MGQNLFSRNLPKTSYSHRGDNGYESKHHKENYGVNGKTTLSMAMDDVPPNKRRRVFPNVAEEISAVKREPVFAFSNSAVSDDVNGKGSRLRKYARVSKEQRLPLSSTAEAKPLAEKRVNRSSPWDQPSSVKKLLDRNNNSFHELRSSKKCSWIKGGLWTTQANNFIPPPCPENLSAESNLTSRSSEKAYVVEVPSCRRNPIRPLGKGSPQQPVRLNGLRRKGTKLKAKQTINLSEDTSDEAFHCRHRKSEDLEKRIVRWDRQRQRELEYYEYLRQREAQKKSSQFAPNLQYTSSVNSAASSVVSPSTKPSDNAASSWSDTSLWPPLENIQFIEILPSNKNLVNVTLFGRPLPAVDGKAAFALPWPVDPATVVPSGSSQKTYVSNSRLPKFTTKYPRKTTRTTTMRQKVNAAKAKVIGASRRKQENSKPSTSSQSSPVIKTRSLTTRSLSLPGEKLLSPRQLEGMLRTRHGLYAKPKTLPTMRRRFSTSPRRRSLRIR